MTEPDEAARARADMTRFETLAEKAYGDMYEARSPLGHYCEAKDYFVDAIAAAERAGLPAEAKRLRDRLMSCIQVYRSQFGNF
jgi:hypothetical protein